MNGEEFKNLYSMQSSDESITPFTNEVGFSLIRKYPESTAYYKDGRKMFIKVAVLKRGFFYGVDMTKPEKTIFLEATPLRKNSKYWHSNKI